MESVNLEELTAPFEASPGGRGRASLRVREWHNGQVGGRSRSVCVFDFY